jgi:hypothetical protein
MGKTPGFRTRVRLYSGKVVEAEITAITNQSTGRKVQIVYDNVTASINPAQMTEVFTDSIVASKSEPLPRSSSVSTTDVKSSQTNPRWSHLNF